MKRKSVTTARDHRIFTDTAFKTKSVNLGKFTFRGGVRF